MLMRLYKIFTHINSTTQPDQVSLCKETETVTAVYLSGSQALPPPQEGWSSWPVVQSAEGWWSRGHWALPHFMKHPINSPTEAVPSLVHYCLSKTQLELVPCRQPGFLRLQLMDNLFYCDSQGRDQRICLWDLAEGRTSVTDSVFTEHVGFCRCSLLKVAQGRWLMAMAARSLEEVGSVSFSVLERLLLLLKWHRSGGEASVPLNSLLKSRQHKKPLGVLITNFTATRMTELYNSCFNSKDTSPGFVWHLTICSCCWCRSFENSSGAAEYWEQESFWGANGQQVRAQVEALIFQLKLNWVWWEEGRCKWFVMQYVVLHPRLIPYLELGLEIVELLLPARGLLHER